MEDIEKSADHEHQRRLRELLTLHGRRRARLRKQNRPLMEHTSEIPNQGLSSPHRFSEAECQGSKASINVPDRGIFGVVDWGEIPVDCTAGLKETAAADAGRPGRPPPTQDIDG